MSCRPKWSPKSEAITENNFEAVDGWINNPSNNSNSVIKGEAHSGNYSYRVDKQHSFGYFYRNKFKDIYNDTITWVKITCYCKSEVDKLQRASVVCSVQDEQNNTILWTEAFLDEFTNGNKDKWVKVEKSFDLKRNNAENLYFGSFVWSTDTADKVLVDDYKIEFFK